MEKTFDDFRWIGSTLLNLVLVERTFPQNFIAENEFPVWVTCHGHLRMLTLTKQTNSYSSSFLFSHQSSVLFQLLELCALLKIIIIMIIIIIIIIFITIRSARWDDHQQPECFCLHHKQRKFEKVCVSNVINNKHQVANNNMQIRRVCYLQRTKGEERDPWEQGWNTLGQLPTSTYQCVLIFSYK